ncbi:MAG: hypothetical protein Satyrvirus3_28 [Satyrvirus sp.]|uniref:NFACT RNA-binding domain-containing protein n=1 Tax=Satyrvirus sp. TaxID=2487771 RepID=A0A3G5AD58_9VIRU|nr:MAG: hypothetical protein Satyrvirus3_28 [Satyrvirus sp.]
MNQNKNIIEKATVPKTTLEIFAKNLGLDINSSPFIGVQFLIGKSSENNWQIYKESSTNDTIFHIDKFPSAYVILNVPMDKLTNELVLVAANLCKSKSKYKNVPNIGILYTQISNTVLGSKSGSFIINSNHKKKVIYV